jgi:copper oxidase (laccase) domain-containing protein
MIQPKNFGDDFIVYMTQKSDVSPTHQETIRNHKNLPTIIHNLGAIAGVDTHKRSWCNQTHSNTVYHVHKPWLQWDGDALYTTIPGIILQVVVADCVPVVLSGYTTDDQPLVAAIHSGRAWTSTNIVQHAVDAMRTTYNINESRRRARIGPSTCGDCYEFGEEAYELFDEQYITKSHNALSRCPWLCVWSARRCWHRSVTHSNTSRLHHRR